MIKHKDETPTPSKRPHTTVPRQRRRPARPPPAALARPPRRGHRTQRRRRPRLDRAVPQRTRRRTTIRRTRRLHLPHVRLGWSGRHRAPSSGCLCDYRLTLTLASLCGYIEDLAARPDWAIPAARWPLAVVRVASRGPRMRGTVDDPAGTVRAAGLQIVGPMFLSPAASVPGAAPAFAAAFECDVLAAGATSFPRWLRRLADRSEVVAATLKDSDNSPCITVPHSRTAEPLMPSVTT